MSQNASKHSFHDVSTRQRPRAFDANLFGGFVVGVLDGLFAFVLYGLILGSKTAANFSNYRVSITWQGCLSELELSYSASCSILLWRHVSLRLITLRVSNCRS